MCVSEYIVVIFSAFYSGTFWLEILGLASRTLGADLRKASDYEIQESATISQLWNQELGKSPFLYSSRLSIQSTLYIQVLPFCPAWLFQPESAMSIISAATCCAMSTDTKGLMVQEIRRREIVAKFQSLSHCLRRRRSRSATVSLNLVDEKNVSDEFQDRYLAGLFLRDRHVLLRDWN